MLTILFLTRFVVIYIKGKKQTGTAFNQRLVPSMVRVKY